MHLFIYFKTLFFGVLILLLSACSPKFTTLDSTPYFIVLKTKELRFADSGFVKKTDTKGYYIELFSSGHALFWLLLEDDRVCSEDGCMSQSKFVKTKLSPHYPSTILIDIVSKKPIFNSKNLIKKDGGFTQSFSDSEYEINYEVTKNSVYFKDSLNGNLIQLKELK